MPNTDPAVFTAGGQPVAAGVEEAALSALCRLRQIAEELCAAAQRSDLEVVGAASRLLEPTLRQCETALGAVSGRPAEAATITAEIQALLMRTEQILSGAMSEVRTRIRRVRQGRRLITQSRGRSQYPAGRRLPASRGA